jgi:hypothetical protein
MTIGRAVTVLRLLVALLVSLVVVALLNGPGSEGLLASVCSLGRLGLLLVMAEGDSVTQAVLVAIGVG